MALSNQEFVEFQQFAQNRLAVGPVQSIKQLANEWSESRELAELIDDVAESEADIAAGRVKPLDQAMSDIREELGWNK